MESISKEFGCWVEEKRTKGMNGSGNEAFYVSEDALRSYWNEGQVSNVLWQAGIHRQTFPPPKAIIESYIRIFSILIYIATPSLPSLGYLSVFNQKGYNDYTLPFQGGSFPGTSEGSEVEARFLRFQFLFSPVVLNPGLHGRELDSRCVLPLTFERQISGRSANSVTTTLYQLHKASKLQVKKDLVVIKEYPKSEIEHSFKNELEAYLSFQYPGNEHYVSEYFLEYYGSFKQNDKGFIILEFADEGSLLEFFKRNKVPRTREELLGFFENLSRLLSGLRLLHAQDFGKTNRQLRGVHEDLKPANIFVTRNEDGGTYKYNFKIGDFGLTSFSPTEAKQIKSRDNKGGIMYNAPEMTNYDEFSRSVDAGINPLVDIWSFGCVLFEAAVWAISDERGREEFRILRCEENDDNHRLRDQGYGASFHNGTTKLNAVDEMLKRILKQRRAFDDITEGFCKLVLKHAMVPVRKPRYDANALWAVIQEYLDYARTSQTSWQASSPTGRASLPDLDRGFRSRSFDDPRTPIDLSGQYRKSLNTSLGGNRPVQKPFNHDMRIIEAETLDYQRFPSDLPEMAYPGNRQDFEPVPILPPPIHGDPLPSNGNGKKADSVKEMSKHNESIRSQLAKGTIPPPNNQTRYLKFRVPDVISWIKGGKKESDELYRCLSVALEKLKKRQQIFIIDDTAAMKKDHWPTVVDTFRALAHLTHEVDPDGIELYFRSSPESPKKLPRLLNKLMGADRLVHRVISQGTKQQDIIFDVEESVSKILDQVKKEISRKNPKTSIYILTDGIWDDATNSDNICGVDHAIRSLVGEMRRQNQMRSHISIQFIRFGDSEVAKSRLKYLDDDLAKESKSYDIVDTTTDRSPVWKMLLGSIIGTVDKATDD